jgi:hypothetical protein
MEIIDEFEPTKRGPYAGAVGYVDYSGNMDTCIALRTMVLAGGRLDVQAGAGIVADSVPEREFEETLNKAGAAAGGPGGRARLRRGLAAALPLQGLEDRRRHQTRHVAPQAGHFTHQVRRDEGHTLVGHHEDRFDPADRPIRQGQLRLVLEVRPLAQAAQNDGGLVLGDEVDGQALVGVDGDAGQVGGGGPDEGDTVLDGEERSLVVCERRRPRSGGRTGRPRGG